MYQSQPKAQPSFYDPTGFALNTSKHLMWTNMATAAKQNNIAGESINQRVVVPNYGTAVARPRRIPKAVTTTTIAPKLMNKSELEEEQIKLFGGEPGDDPSLCFKMLEAFGRMEWIDG
jgi:hypothetical protein